MAEVFADFWVAGSLVAQAVVGVLHFTHMLSKYFWIPTPKIMIP